jgi:hypothetical protein
MPTEAIVRFERFLQGVRRNVEHCYGPTVVFEHGPAQESSGVGCGIDHAHAHIVPWTGDLADGVRKRYPSLTWHGLLNLQDLKASVPSSEPYLYLQPADGPASAASGAQIPNQLIRREIASALGQPGRYDWNDYPRYDLVQRTVSTLHMTLRATA